MPAARGAQPGNDPSSTSRLPPAPGSLPGSSPTSPLARSLRPNGAARLERGASLLLQPLRVGLVASGFLFFWLGAAVLAWTVCPVIALRHENGPQRWRATQRIVRGALRLFHGYLAKLGLVETTVAASASAGPAGAFVMVANHPTLVDATALLAAYADLTVVVQSNLMLNFFVGRLLRCSGYIDGGNGDAMSGAAILLQAQDRLARGFGVLIFPEGTRSPPGAMRAWRVGAFELARRAGVPLWPVFVSCEPPALYKGLPISRHPREVARQCIRLGDTICLAGTVSDAYTQGRRVEASFRERVGSVRSTDAW